MKSAAPSAFPRGISGSSSTAHGRRYGVRLRSTFRKSRLNLTSSQSRKRDEIPTLASRASCFNGACLSACADGSYVSSTGLNSRLPSGSHSLWCSSPGFVLTWWPSRRVVYIGQHAHAFTQANDLAWNLRNTILLSNVQYAQYSTQVDNSQ